jgi:hypothetical protein
VTNRPVVALAVLFLFGCTVSSGVDRPPLDDIEIDPASPVDNYVITAFVNDYATAVCGWFVRCGGTIGQLFVDNASCLSISLFTLESQLQSGGRSLTDPLLYRVDSVKTHACVDAVASRACADGAPSLNRDDNCQGAFVGRLADGECCDERGGCGPGLVCEHDTHLGNFAGFCSAVGEAGETCFVQECAAGAGCQDQGDVSTCLVPLGLDSGMDCDSTFDCGPGLACAYSGAARRNLCLLRPEVGEFCYLPERPCAADLPCISVAQEGFKCSSTAGVEGNGCFVDGDCGTAMTCTNSVCAAPNASGEACDDDDPTQRCLATLACVDGFCAEIPVPVAIGDPCLPNGPECPGAFGEGDCRPSPTGYRCTSPAQENEPCGEDLPDCDISRSLICDETTLTCKKLPGLGEACEGLCANFFEVSCTDALCVRRLAEGEPCTPNGDEDPKEIFNTACVIFSSCVLDETTGQHLCKRPEAVVGAGTCQQ